MLSLVEELKKKVIALFLIHIGTMLLVEDCIGVIRTKSKRGDGGGLRGGSWQCWAWGSPAMCRFQGFHFLSPTGQPSPWDRPTPMDPTRLSMEQGKEFLKHLGIPQRDVSAGEAGQVTGGGRRRPPSLEPRQLLPP